MEPIGVWAYCWFWPKSIIAAPTATPPDCVVSLTMLSVSVTLSFLWGRVVSPALNTQPEGPGDHSLSGLYPLTCSAWVALPGVQDSC